MMGVSITACSLVPKHDIIDNLKGPSNRSADHRRLRRDRNDV